MRMNTNIPMMIQQPDTLNTLARANQAAAFQNDARQTNALRSFLQESGPAVMAGDPSALAGLARFDPNMALGVQDRRQTMELRSEQIAQVRRQAAEQARAAAAQISAQEAAMEAAQARDAVIRAGAYAQQGDLDAVNKTLADMGLPTIRSIEDFPFVAATVDGAIEGLTAAQGLMRGPEQKQTATEEKINLLGEIGYPRAQAIEILTLNDVQRDPLTGELFIINKASGQRVGAQPVAGGVQPVADSAPAAPEGGLTFGNQFEGADRAFGLEGFGRRVANVGADAIGAPAPFPDTLEAQRDFGVFSETLLNDFAAAYQRQPPSWVLQAIAELTPKAGRPFEGPQVASSKIRALGRDFESRRNQITQRLRGRLDPNVRADLEAQVLGIDAVLSQLNNALQGIEGGAGLRPDVLERLNAYE